MPKKRSNGEGNVRKTKNGSWRGEIMDGYTSDGKKNIVRFTAETRAEVLDKIRAYRTNMDSGVRIDRKMHFASWADAWYEDYKSEVQPSTYSGYQYTLNALKKGVWGAGSCGYSPNSHQPLFGQADCRRLFPLDDSQVPRDAHSNL